MSTTEGNTDPLHVAAPRLASLHPLTGYRLALCGDLNGRRAAIESAGDPSYLRFPSTADVW